MGAGSASNGFRMRATFRQQMQLLDQVLVAAFRLGLGWLPTRRGSP